MGDSGSPKMRFDVVSVRLSAHASESRCKDAVIGLDTDLSGNRQAFNPAELLLAALSACMIKGIERMIPLLKFQLRGIEVKLHGVRQDSPPKMISINYELIVDTEEDDRRLALLHANVRKYGTISNTVAAAAKLEGTIRRKQ